MFEKLRLKVSARFKWRKGSGYPKNLNTETESLGKVQGFGMHEVQGDGMHDSNGEKGVGTLRI